MEATEARRLLQQIVCTLQDARFVMNSASSAVTFYGNDFSVPQSTTRKTPEGVTAVCALLGQCEKFIFRRMKPNMRPLYSDIDTVPAQQVLEEITLR